MPLKLVPNRCQACKLQGCRYAREIREDEKEFERMLSLIALIREKYDKLLNNPDTFIPQNLMALPAQPIQTKIDNDKFHYSEVVKLKKKDNLTPEVCFITQLSQIPRISNNSAKQIASQYKNMINLCKEWETYKKENDKPELFLKDFKITGKNEKVRNLGTKSSLSRYPCTSSLV